MSMILMRNRRKKQNQRPNGREKEKAQRDRPISFGPYSGTPISGVPASYLIWFFAQSWSKTYPEEYSYVYDNLQELEGELDRCDELAENGDVAYARRMGGHTIIVRKD